MLNQVILVGRVASDMQFQHYDNGLIKISLDLNVGMLNERQESNVQTIPITLNGNIAMISGEYLKVGMTVGVKGSIMTRDSKIEVVADKLTFINTSTSEDINN